MFEQIDRFTDAATSKQRWGTFCRAIGTELREHSFIVGASGVEHPVQAIGVDDPGKRVVIISAEPNPRVAAMVQGDVQATLPGTRVIVARPLAVDLTTIARHLIANFSIRSLQVDDLAAWAARFNALNEKKQSRAMKRQVNRLIVPALDIYSNISYPVVIQIVSLIQQAAAMDWSTLVNVETKTLNLEGFADKDNLALDLKYGVCPVPLYEFSRADWALMAAPKEYGDFAERLKELGIYQYFFPPADELALGLIDRGLRRNGEIISTIENAVELGHPIAAGSILDTANLREVLDGLASAGYIAEGEHGVELSPDGETTRSTIRYRPREGLISKLISRFSVSIDISLKDVFKG